jgi:hypothetical protein
MTDRDRPTPVDPLRSAQAAPCSPIGGADAQRVAREAASVQRRLEAQRRAIPPPPPKREQERKQTPVSGGIETQAQPDAIELDRRARVAAETRSPASFPPKVEERRPSPAPASVAPESKAPTRAAWAKLGYRVVAAAVAAVVLIIAALGFWAVAAINAKAEATKAAQAAKVKETQTREEKWRSWAAVAVWILDCRDRRNVKAGEMLLPDAQKMGSARKMEAWQNNCPVELPPPP